MRLLYAREHRLMLEFERSIATEFDATLFVSDAEAKRFAALAPAQSSRIQVLTNGVDLDYFEPGNAYANPFPGDGPFIVFTGAMDYWPNIEAVTWFARHVLPMVRRHMPGAEFWIVGRDPARAVRQLSEADLIHVTGTVEDIRPYMAHASVIVAPLQTGRGLQNKVLEAMAMAKTVVASPLACEGINLAARQDISVAAAPEDFATAVISLLSRDTPSRGDAARAAIERDYRWDFTVLDQLLDGPAPRRAAGQPG
jgi:sugar transferase (PEP-CTERM/EpsH1 system associated)